MAGSLLWGTSNSVALGVAHLLRPVEPPEVLFSPMKSRPRKADVAPRTSADECFDVSAPTDLTSRLATREARRVADTAECWGPQHSEF